MALQDRAFGDLLVQDSQDEQLQVAGWEEGRDLALVEDDVGKRALLEVLELRLHLAAPDAFGWHSGGCPRKLVVRFAFDGVRLEVVEGALHEFWVFRFAVFLID